MLIRSKHVYTVLGEEKSMVLDSFVKSSFVPGPMDDSWRETALVLRRLAKSPPQQVSNPETGQREGKPPKYVLRPNKTEAAAAIRRWQLAGTLNWRPGLD